MEDASIHINNFPQKGHYLFGVFDGHGGAEVAQYVQKHFSLELYLNRKFKEQKYD
jgi:protein phosphatase 1G